MHRYVDPVFFNQNPPFSLIREKLERWALSRVVKLELFLFHYMGGIFILHKNQLKLVKLLFNDKYSLFEEYIDRDSTNLGVDGINHFLQFHHLIGYCGFFQFSWPCGKCTEH